MPASVDRNKTQSATGDQERSREPERSPEGAGQAFHHETLFYLGEDDFLAGTLPFITEALTAGESLLAVLSKPRMTLLVDALGDAAARASFTDIDSLGRNPARLIPLWRGFLDRRGHDGRPLRGISELPWSGRSTAELTEYQRHEALMNLAFEGGHGWRLLCPYDLTTVDEQIIEAAKRSHPFVKEDGASRRSEIYESDGSLEGVLPDPGAEVLALAFTAGELATLRRSVAQWASDAPLAAERTEQLVLSVNELATNSIRYGGGQGVLRMWREDESLVCEVCDRGRIDEPLVGRIAPKPDQLAGRGLWLVNQFCDLVQIRSSASGNVVRLHLRVSEV